jgi:hypothetical protein
MYMIAYIREMLNGNNWIADFALEIAKVSGEISLEQYNCLIQS